MKGNIAFFDFKRMLTYCLLVFSIPLLAQQYIDKEEEMDIEMEITTFDELSVRKFPTVFYGLMNSSGKELLPLTYERIILSSGVALVKTENSMYCIIDSTGTEVVPPVYGKMYPFAKGLIRAKKNDKWGVMNVNGKTIIPFEYDIISESKENIAKAKKAGKWGMLSLSGKIVVPFRYDWIDAFDLKDGILLAKKGNLWGLIDPISGKEKFAFVYESIKTVNKKFAIVKKGGLQGIITPDGKEIIPCRYGEIKSFDGEIAKVKRGSRFGLVTKAGKELTTMDLIDAGSIKNGLCPIVNQSFRYGLINMKGDTLMPFVYNHLEVAPKVIIAKVNNRQKIFDLNGKELIPHGYQRIDGFYKNDMAIVMEENKYGVIDAVGTLLIPLDYDCIEFFSDSLLKICKDKKTGIVD